jgi:hypothetical protein
MRSSRGPEPALRPGEQFVGGSADHLLQRLRIDGLGLQSRSALDHSDQLLGPPTSLPLTKFLNACSTVELESSPEGLS